MTLCSKSRASWKAATGCGLRDIESHTASAGNGRSARRDGNSLMRRALFLAGLVLGLLLLAGLGASISLVRSIRSRISLTPDLAVERSTTA